MSLTYLDSVILIYSIDGTPQDRTRALVHLSLLRSTGGYFAISDLTRLECLILPKRQKDQVAIATFHSVFQLPEIVTVPLGSQVFDRATQIRADYNFKLGDSLHLAAAVEAGCDRFLTNDYRLARFQDIAVEILP